MGKFSTTPDSEKSHQALRAKQANTTHGLSKSKEYKLWSNMLQRCYNKNHDKYKLYGGRGITVCFEWRYNFKTYYDYITSLQGAMQSELTVDRINFNKNYKEGNLRWANHHIQNANKRKMKRNTSEYTGVYGYNNGYSYKAEININKKRIRLGTHKTAREAAIARDQYIITNKLWEYPLQVLPKQ